MTIILLFLLTDEVIFVFSTIKISYGSKYLIIFNTRLTYWLSIYQLFKFEYLVQNDVI